MRFLLAFQQDPDPFQIISSFLESPILRISGQLVLLLFIVLWVSLVYWTYADASRRGAMSVLWGFIAFIFPTSAPWSTSSYAHLSTSKSPANASWSWPCWSAS